MQFLRASMSSPVSRFLGVYVKLQQIVQKVATSPLDCMENSTKNLKPIPGFEM